MSQGVKFLTFIIVTYNSPVRVKESSIYVRMGDFMFTSCFGT